jgi:hypothetical protein
MRGDSVHEGQKRPALVAVTGQGREHRETHLLSYIIRRSERSFVTTNAGTAIPHHEGTDLPEHALDGCPIAVDGLTD